MVMMRYISNCSYFSMVAILLLLGLLLACLEITSVQSIGVCYGTLGNDLPPPQEVVDLYRSMNIGSMRIYDPNQAILQALRGTNIELMLSVPNTDFQHLASHASAANNWVERNIRNYTSNVRFKYIAVGNEVNPSDPNAANVLPAMQNIYNAIASAGLQNQIKVSTAINPAGLLGESYPPSRGAFRSDVRSFIDPIIEFLVNNRAPLLANVYPYFSYLDELSRFPLDYALFRSNIVDEDGQFQYRNLFDVIVDALYSALEKAGGSALEIVVSESGWPSSDGPAIENARAYNQNLINHVKGGTPKRSGRPIETYVFAMFNENEKISWVYQHFGLFFPNKQPVYPINFSSVPSPDLPTFLLSCESCCHGSNLVIQLTSVN